MENDNVNTLIVFNDQSKNDLVAVPFRAVGTWQI